MTRKTLYYQPAGESQEKLALMRLLDEQHPQTPCYGVLKYGGVFAQSGPCGERQASQAFAAEDEAGGGVPETQHQPAEPGT